MAKGKGVFRAKETAHVDLDGTVYTVNRGEFVREGHPLIKGHEALFEAVEESFIRYDVEEATAEPGKKRGEK